MRYRVLLLALISMGTGISCAVHDHVMARGEAGSSMPYVNKKDKRKECMNHDMHVGCMQEKHRERGGAKAKSDINDADVEFGHGHRHHDRRNTDKEWPQD